MSVFFIGTANVKGPVKFQEYGVKAMQTFPTFDGKVMMRGKTDQVLTGKSGNQEAVVVRFPNMDALKNWFNSEEYQALIPLHDVAADLNIMSYAEPI